MDNNSMLALLAIGFVVMMWANQQKFNKKIYCTFRRPNGQIIERFVPITDRWVKFDNGMYLIDPNCIAWIWFERGLNKLWPMNIPCMEFRWDTPYPLNPKTHEVTWQTPGVVNASYQSYSHQAFAKGAVSQTGVKKSLLDKYGIFFVVGILLIIGYLVYTQGNQLAFLEQLIKAKG